VRYWKAFSGAVAVAAVTVFAAPVGAAEANVTLTRVSSDPFTNSTSQHATEVEPDTFAHGSTVVGAFQVGRFFSGGSTDIGFARSGDGGATWGTPGFLGLTSSADAASPYERVSDPSVAFDAAHGTWLISAIPLLPNLVVPTVLVSRSVDDGQTWSPPATIPPPAAKTVNLDKNWTVCDNTASSPFYGHCYTELDNFGAGDLELMSTSTDDGLTWSPPIPTAAVRNPTPACPRSSSRSDVTTIRTLSAPATSVCAPYSPMISRKLASAAIARNPASASAVALPLSSRAASR